METTETIVFQSGDVSVVSVVSEIHTKFCTFIITGVQKMRYLTLTQTLGTFVRHFC